MASVHYFYDKIMEDGGGDPLPAEQRADAKV